MNWRPPPPPPRPAPSRAETPGAWSYFWALVIPLVGFILAILWFSRGKPSQAFALLLTAFAGAILGTFLIATAGIA